MNSLLSFLQRYKLQIFLLTFIFLSNTLSASENNSEDEYKKGILQVKITTQTPNFQFPWLKKKPISKDSIGAYTGKGQILVLASEVEYATSIEVKKFSSHTLVNGVIERIDYESNLALINIEDQEFIKDLQPIQFQNKMGTNRQVSILQLDNAGMIQSSRGRLTGIDIDNYTNSYTELPFFAISSNEKQEGVGELILFKDQFLGMLYRYNTSKNSGKAIPGFIINYFLKNGKKNSPFAFIGFKYRPLLDSDTKEYYGLDKKMEGILVEEVYPYSSADQILQTEDIILEAGGYKIDSQGFFMHPEYGKQSINFLVNAGFLLGFSKGSLLPLKIIRNKEELNLEMKLKSFPYKAIKIPHMHNFGKNALYTIRGGYVFVELTEFFLREWGTAWRSKADKKLLYLIDYAKFHETGQSGRIILLVQVLPDESNNGFHHLSLEIVSSMNGQKINSIKDLNKRIDSAKEEIIGILLENGVTITIDKKNLDEIDKKIMKKFGIPRLNNLK
jgi:hypothetical protein